MTAQTLAQTPAPPLGKEHCPLARSMTLPSEVRRSVRECHPALWLLSPLLLLVASRYLFAPTDFDYWWHLKTGQLILTSGAVPRADVFSYTSLGQPWVPHEWLTQVVYAVVERQFGFAGLSVIWGTLGSLLWLTVYRTDRKSTRLNSSH